MEKVKVTFYSWVARMLWEEGKNSDLKGSEVSLELPVPAQGTLQGLLERLVDRYPLFASDIYDKASARFNPRVILLLNGRSIVYSQLPDTQIKAGDLVALVPITEGG